MSSAAGGYPDFQRITQWLGAALVSTTGLVIGAGTHVDGPLQLGNFASIVVALKATGGNVTVTVKQTIPNGPASLVLTQQVVVPAGGMVFEAFVLFGATVEVDLTGSVAGTSVDYALYGSNTTTNAQVITSATINVQQNDVLVAAEPTIDLEDNGTFVWSVVDDAPNTRVKITPPQLDTVKIADTTLAVDTATIDFQNIPQTYMALRLELYARASAAVFSDILCVRCNNDAGANYDGFTDLLNAGAPGAGTDGLGATSGATVYVPGSSASALLFGAATLTIPGYAGAANYKAIHGSGHHSRVVGSAGNQQYTVGGAIYKVAAAINRLTLFGAAGGFKTGTRVALYGIR